MPGAVPKQFPAAMPEYCTLREQCLACFQDDLGPARGSNISFCTFWEPNRWRHSENSRFHDPHMTFANLRLPPGPPKRFKNEAQTKEMQQKNASPSQFEAETAPDQCPADAMPLSSRARPKILPRCPVGCPATSSERPQNDSRKPDAASKALPAAMSGYWYPSGTMLVVLPRRYWAGARLKNKLLCALGA